MCIAYVEVRAVVGMAIYPCVDVTVGDVVAKFCGERHVEWVASIAFFDCCVSGKMMGYNHYLIGSAIVDRVFDELEILLGRVLQ